MRTTTVTTLATTPAAHAAMISATSTTTHATTATATTKATATATPDVFRREMLRIARSLQKVVHESMVPICQKYGLTAQQVYVLTELGDDPGQSAGQISDRAGILRTNFAGVCHKLEERGLLERRRSVHDRRAYELYVTDKGCALLQKVDDEIRQSFGPLLEAEPPETFEAIFTGFRTLRDFTERIGH